VRWIVFTHSEWTDLAGATCAIAGSWLHSALARGLRTTITEIRGMENTKF
jgi:hypothetical protein